jgi:hypothetical protein
MLCAGPRNPFNNPLVEVTPRTEADWVALALAYRAKPNGSSIEFRFAVFVTGVNFTMSVRAEFFPRAIHLATPRMDVYRKNGLKSLNIVLKSQKIQASSADNEDWEPELRKLEGLMEEKKQLLELAEWCYQNRRSWSEIIERELAQDKDIHWFKELKHYL